MLPACWFWCQAALAPPSALHTAEHLSTRAGAHYGALHPPQARRRRAAPLPRASSGAGARQTPRSGPPGAPRGAAALQALKRALATLVGALGFLDSGLARVRARAAAAAAADGVGVLCVHRVGASGGRQRHRPAQCARGDEACGTRCAPLVAARAEQLQ